MENDNKHELQAQANLLQTLLNQTQCEAVGYLEAAVGAIVASMNKQTAKTYNQEFAKVCTLSAEQIDCVENKRKAWRAELAELSSLIESMPE